VSEKKGSAGNDGFHWSDFDSEAYFQQYYGEPHPDDDQVVRRACAAMLAALPSGDALETIDVGTGPNLFPLFCVLPRATRVTAWEYEKRNVDWLKAELSRDSPARPQWQHFWKLVTEAYEPRRDLPENPIPVLRQKADIRQGSIFSLPARRWDAATMFFCAESITEKLSEFREACTRFAQSVKTGGTLAAAFLAGSSGYAVEGQSFPAVKISDDDIREVFAPLAHDVRTERIGIVDREVRSGYT
jgi:hypothetical protein